METKMDAMHGLARIGISMLFGAALSANAIGQVAAIPHEGGMEYLNGGIGKEQADLMRDKSAQFPVRMTFSEHMDGQDEFVADIHLRVTDGHGRTVLDLPAQGPIFLLRLPPGSYAVEAFGIEGTGCSGVGLARHLRARDVQEPATLTPWSTWRRC